MVQTLFNFIIIVIIIIYLFIFLFLAVLGLRCCTQAFSSCREWGLVASLVAEHGL